MTAAIYLPLYSWRAEGRLEGG